MLSNLFITPFFFMPFKTNNQCVNELKSHITVMPNNNFHTCSVHRADNTREGSVDSNTSMSSSNSSYNGSNPELLRERGENLQVNVDDYKACNSNMESVKSLAYKKDNGEPLTHSESNLLNHVQNNYMDDFDPNLSFSANIAREISENMERISILEEKISAKLAKADELSSVEGNNSSTNNISPTQYVHELESEQPMDYFSGDE